MDTPKTEAPDGWDDLVDLYWHNWWQGGIRKRAYRRDIESQCYDCHLWGVPGIDLFFLGYKVPSLLLCRNCMPIQEIPHLPHTKTNYLQHRKDQA